MNNVENVELEMIRGMCKAYPKQLRKLEVGNIVVRVDQKTDKVTLLSGGGSGHEPSHGGFVGLGMLDCAVAGPVYTSPTVDMVYEGIKAVATEQGVLLVVKNYTGDVMNFEMAAEMADAEGIKTAMVITNDDVAVQDSLYTTGRRGVAGTVFVHKCAGAAAEAGKSLEEVKCIAEKVISNVRTMGMALKPSTVPAAGKPGFELEEDEIEIGIGIHGEPGTHKGKMMTSDEIVAILMDKILADIDYANKEVAVLINGGGSTPLMELFIVNDKVHDILQTNGCNIVKTYVGNYMTSIDMCGFSISVLALDDELKGYLEETANTPAWKE